METRVRHQLYSGILIAFTILNILFSTIFFLNGSLLGLGIALSLQAIYAVALILTPQKNMATSPTKLNNLIRYTYFGVCTFGFITLIHGAAYGWKYTLFTAILGCIFYICLEKYVMPHFKKKS